MCREIRSLEEKSHPSGRDLYKMGAQVVPDARAGDILTF